MSKIPQNSESDDDFMKASAEEWSKPDIPQPLQPKPETKTDRWGAPLKSANLEDGNRWGAEKLDSEDSPQLKDLFPKKEGEKKKLPWWVILLIVLPIICVCGSVITLLVIFL